MDREINLPTTPSPPAVVNTGTILCSETINITEDGNRSLEIGTVPLECGDMGFLPAPLSFSINCLENAAYEAGYDSDGGMGPYFDGVNDEGSLCMVEDDLDGPGDAGTSSLLRGEFLCPENDGEAATENTSSLTISQMDGY